MIQYKSSQTNSVRTIEFRLFLLVITARYVNSIIAVPDEVIDSLTQKLDLGTLLRPDNWFRALADQLDGLLFHFRYWFPR